MSEYLEATADDEEFYISGDILGRLGTVLGMHYQHILSLRIIFCFPTNTYFDLAEFFVKKQVLETIFIDLLKVFKILLKFVF